MRRDYTGIIFINVDLPAPLPPNIACLSRMQSKNKFLDTSRRRNNFINVLHKSEGCSIVTDLHVASAPSMLTDGTEQMFLKRNYSKPYGCLVKICQDKISE